MWSRSSVPTCATSRSATGWWSRRRSPADRAPIAGRAITRSAPKPTPTGPRRARPSSGGPESTGPFDGLQADKARIPYANVGLVKLPEEVNDEDAILISDIFPTGYFGADIAEIRAGDIVAVFGCGPVGQFAILSAKLPGAGRVLAVDGVEDRLEIARRQGAEVIDFNREDPVETIKRLTGGIGVDRVIDAVGGVDAERPKEGPAAAASAELEPSFRALRSRPTRPRSPRRTATGSPEMRPRRRCGGRLRRSPRPGRCRSSASTRRPWRPSRSGSP